ncbi:hypothetical protein MMC30_006491 [Trapelia coarctata]|nr:hypothetical protein [Trapelia coarctata]
MSICKTFRRPLSMIAEAQYICRCFSTRTSLTAAQHPYESSTVPPNPISALPKLTSPGGAALLGIDNEETSRTKKFDALQSYTRSTPSKRPQGKALLDESDRQVESNELEKLQTRRWKKGDVYAPHDLSPAEMRKWRQRSKPNRDVFDMLNINPLDEYKNYSMMAEFTTSMGRIKNPRDTGLRPVNQRRVARAIRRAVGMGWLPSVHVHPEFLRRGKAV